MPIANYTTKIDPERTIGEIQRTLRKLKVRSASVQWDEQGVPVGMAFVVETGWGPREYLLPANVDGVWAVMRRQINPRVDRAQAARTAWRTVQDWVEAQVAFIEAGAISFEQVMLPYMAANDSGTTVYQLWEHNQLALPAPSKKL